MTRFLVWLIMVLSVGCAAVIGLAQMVGRVLPDTEIAYAAQLDDDTNYGLYLLSVQRQLVVPLTRDSYNNIAPEWSPDGKQLAFISTRDDLSYLYLADLSTGEYRPLSPTTVIRTRPEWSPDGRSILYNTIEFGDASLAIFDLQTATSRQLNTKCGTYFTPSWSPDGQQVMFISDRSVVSNTNVFSIDVASGSIQPYLATQGADLSLAWSPTGRYLLYTVDQIPPAIFLWDTVEQQFHALGVPVSTNSNPAWSPDGRMIVYTAFIGNGGMGIYRLDVAACLASTQICNPDLLTRVVNGIFAAPQWRPLPS